MDKKNRERNHVLEIIDDSIPNLLDVIDRCKKGLEHHKEHIEEMKKLMNKKEALTEEEAQKAETFFQEAIKMKDDIKESSKDFQLLLMHVVQPFYVNFELQMFAIPDKYEDITQAKVEVGLHQAEWFHKIMELTKLVIIEIEDAKDKMLNEGEV